MDLDKIRSSIEQSRAGARVRFLPRSHVDSGKASLDEIGHAIIATEKLSKKGGWFRAPRAEALERVTEALAYDMAYKTPLLDRVVAATLAQSYLDAFGVDALHMTNVDKSRGARSPVSPATFECCLVSVGRDLAGLLLIEDED